MKESEQFRKGVVLFNARKFFEAHEVWEELWLVEPEPEKTFLQGLIQVAAACHHDSRGNHEWYPIATGRRACQAEALSGRSSRDFTRTSASGGGKVGRSIKRRQ